MERELSVGRIYKHYGGEYYVVIGVDNDLVMYRNMKTGDEWSEPIKNFLEAKVPSDYKGTSKQEYCFERADVIHKLDKPKIELAVIKNDGYCPCSILKSNDTKCMCKAFREQMVGGPCHCGLYTKIWVGDQM